MADNSQSSGGLGDSIRTREKATGIKSQVIVVDKGGSGAEDLTPLEGTDITTPTAMPTGGVGVRGWLSAIWTKLNGVLDISDRIARLLGVINTGIAITSATTVLQNAVVVTGNGTSLVVTGYGTAVLSVGGTFVGTIAFETFNIVTATWVAISATQIGAGDIFNVATVPGVYRLTVAGLDQIRARVTLTSGTITINGWATNAINASKIMKLATGGLTIGKVFLTDGTNSVGVTSSNLAGNETLLDRAKVNASLRLFDTAQATGAQLVAAKGDQTLGLWVNVKNSTLATGAAQDGTDITAPTAMPAGGLGIRGWLSSIWTKLNGSLAVTGAFFQATQPVSLAANTPDVTDRAARILGVVTQQAIAKGVQGTNGVTTQDLKDAGRVMVSFSATQIAGVTVEALISLTPYRDLVVGTAATTFAVTAGKRLRIQSMTVTWRNNTAAAGGVTVRLRFLAGVVAVTSPVYASLNASTGLATIGSGTSAFEDFPDGLELSGTMQLGISQIATGAVSGFDINVIGYEY